MTSTLLPHTELLEAVRDETGISNIRNFEEKLKRFSLDAEEKIGYNTAMVFKYIAYELDGTNYNGKDLWLPKDCYKLRMIFDGRDEIPFRDYQQTGDYVYFQDGKEPKEPIVYYEAITFNGHGWPLMARDHKAAIVSYIKWKMYAPKAYLSNNRSDRSLLNDYEIEWLDRRDEARGNDVIPKSETEFRQLAATWNASTIEAVMGQCCIVHESKYALEAQKNCVLRTIPKTVEVYRWQYGDLVTNISTSPSIDLNWLRDNTQLETLETMLLGKTISYEKIGRIGFALQNVEPGEFHIYDILNHRVDDNVFDSYYNALLKMQIFISKEFYSISNMYFRLEPRP